MAHSPDSWPIASGEIAIISAITPAKILEPSSKDFYQRAVNEVGSTLANQRIDGSATVCADDPRWEDRLRTRLSGIIGQAHPIKLFDLHITPETYFRK
jgi:hypothetical protein